MLGRACPRRGGARPAPGTGVPGWCARCARPSTLPRTGQGCHCPGPGAGPNVLPTPTRDRTGNSLGRRSRNQETAFRSEEVRSEGSRIRFTSRITGSSANRPGGPSGRQRSSLGHLYSANRNALRYRRAFSRPAPDRAGAGSGGAAGTLARRDRARAAQDAAPVEVGLDDAGRRHELRVARDGARRASRCRTARTRRSGPACGRGTCRTRPVTFALLQRRRRPAAEVADPVLDQRPGRRRGPRRLAADRFRPRRRLAGQRRPRRACDRRPGCVAGRWRSCPPVRSPGGSASGAAGRRASGAHRRRRSRGVAGPVGRRRVRRHRGSARRRRR